MAKFCPNCGAKLAGNSKFCHECGFSLQNMEKEVSQEVVTVSNNETNVENDDFFADFADVQQKDNAKLDASVEKIERLYVNYQLDRAYEVMNTLPEDVIDTNLRLEYLVAVAFSEGEGPFEKMEDRQKAALGFFIDLYEKNYALAAIDLLGYNVDEERMPELINKIRENINYLEQQNDALTQDKLGYLYSLDKSDMVDYNKSIYFYTKAAQAGYWHSMTQLGKIYFSGEYTNIDVQKGLNYLEKAASIGCVSAALMMGRIYYGAQFVPVDMEKAKRGYSIAASQNNEEALNELANIYLEEHNYPMFIDLCNRNIKFNKSSDAASSLGYAYMGFNEQYEGFPTDSYMGIKLLNKALEFNSGNELAILGLGIAYIAGEGVNQNLELAKQYIYKVLNSNEETIKQTAEQALNAIRMNEQNQQNQQQKSDGCFITTAVCDSFDKPDNCYELTAFRNFRDNWLRKEPDGEKLIAEYYDIAPKIVEKINSLPNAKTIYYNIWKEYLGPCLNDLQHEDNNKCKKIYVSMVNNLSKMFLK